MVLLKTPIIDFNSNIIDFNLKSTDGDFYNLDKIDNNRAILIMFICNHCPYVIDMLEHLNKSCEYLIKQGVGIIGIMSNDFDAYPEDNFDNMKKLTKDYNLCFPYVIDTTQKVAKDYGAVCTPDFFGFDCNKRLKYRGRLWNKKFGVAYNKDVNIELLSAMESINNNKEYTNIQNPSMGCSIKWR